MFFKFIRMVAPVVLLAGIVPVQAEQFTIVMIGDTEDYTEEQQLNQGFLALTQWTADNAQKRNIAFLTHVGDIVQDETHGPDRNLTPVSYTHLTLPTILLV